jgi:hypothetical protein
MGRRSPSASVRLMIPPGKPETEKKNLLARSLAPTGWVLQPSSTVFPWGEGEERETRGTLEGRTAHHKLITACRQATRSCPYVPHRTLPLPPQDPAR